VHNLFLNQD